MKRYLYRAIKKYLDEDAVSLHVPGHKNGRAYKDKEQIFDFRFDVTEISGTDNLHYPVDAIYNAQKQAALFYGAKETYFLVNGTTCGIQAMIFACTSPKDKIIIARNSHKSVYNACIMGELNPIMVYPEMDEKYGLVLGISPKHIANLLKEHYDVKAVVITSPTYEGIHSDIKAIADIVHQYGAVLLVDEAHGAHVPLDSRCGLSAISQGADAVVQSTHKSLSSLTQSSMLHIATDRVDLYKVKNWLSMLQSSSPSYLLMLSLEKAICDMDSFGCLKMNTLISKLEEFRSSFNSRFKDFERNSQSNNDIILTSEYIVKKGYNLDVTKLSIFHPNAIAIEEILRKDFGIQVEYSVKNHLVCVFSIWNNERDLIRLEGALNKILYDDKYKSLQKLPSYNMLAMPFISERKLSAKEAFYSKGKTIELKKAIGEICLETIVPYPPGIPLIMSGEVFKIEHYNYLMMCKNNNIGIIGQRDKELSTIYCL